MPRRALQQGVQRQLSHRDETLCDPRLDARQWLDHALPLAELMRVA